MQDVIFSDCNTVRLLLRSGYYETLTLSRPMLPSYRNLSVDLLCRSTDWFLYDGNIGLQNVKLRLTYQVISLSELPRK